MSKETEKGGSRRGVSASPQSVSVERSGTGGKRLSEAKTFV